MGIRLNVCEVQSVSVIHPNALEIYVLLKSLQSPKLVIKSAAVILPNRYYRIWDDQT